jgi:hypothetical protein
MWPALDMVGTIMVQPYRSGWVVPQRNDFFKDPAW